MNKKCVVCESFFQAKTVRAKYCSKKCANHSRFDRSIEQIRRDNTELQKTVLDLYASGLNDRQISERIGKSVGWVYQMRQKLSLPKNKSKAQLEKDRLDVWRESFKREKRTCKQCNAEFSPTRVNQLFCCSDCQRKNNHQTNDIKRKRILNKSKIEDITLEEVYKTFGGVCQICGDICDWNDYKIVDGIKRARSRYPSRDHIRPLSEGGLHAWANIQLAHIGCNSRKGASLEE